MPRIARVAIENVPYHITQRGNARQQVFFDASDYRLYLDLLRVFAGDARLQLTAYCLMPNHVHLIAVPERPDSMASALGRTHANFARYFNLKRITCGHVWQARYFSCPLDQAHLSRAIAYVERNPVRAGLVEQNEQYEWSSVNKYTRALDVDPDELSFGRRLQESSRRGRPLGSEEFVRELESRTGRGLRPLSAGRPRKSRCDDEGQLSLKIGV